MAISLKHTTAAVGSHTPTAVKNYITFPDAQVNDLFRLAGEQMN